MSNCKYAMRFESGDHQYAPPVGRTQLQLFRIDPVELPVEQSRRAVAGQARFFFGSDVETVQILLPAERDQPPVGREFRVALGFGGGGQLLGLAVLHLDQEQVAVGAHQHPGAGARPLVARFRHAPVLPVKSVSRHALDRLLSQANQGDDLLFQFRSDIVLPDRIAFAECETLAVRRPGDGAAAGAWAARSGHVVERDRTFLGRRGNGQRQQQNDESARHVRTTLLQFKRALDSIRDRGY